MSKALDYLQQARPDAVGSYFKFLKESGRHLDKKTRALISVITKVDNQTEAGFRQYLSRALQAGASPDEILDAMLTAFPTLGLSKIIWAIEIIVEMDLPEFYPENLGQPKQWHKVIEQNDLHDVITFVECDDKQLFIYRDNSVLRVYDSLCPHQQTHIPSTAICDNHLVCPRHQWKFDLKTGACLEKGDRPLNEINSEIREGALWCEW